MAFAMRYVTPEQIYMMYNKLDLESRYSILFNAFEIKEHCSGMSRENCIAKVMGYDLSISGSGFYERVCGV